MDKVISFSLWGNNPKYTIGAIRNAELTNSIYPGWKSRFYISNDVDEKIIEKIKNIENSQIIRMSSIDGWASMFWRFYSSFDDTVEASIFRDTDSRLSLREKYAVDEWLASDKTFHIMRDHPYHRFPILGGMWGMKKNTKYDMKQLIASFDKTDRYGTDYEFFDQVLYPMIVEDQVVHDEFFEHKSFPQVRLGNEFIGDVFDENENRHSEYYKHINIV
jgi:hypothetical protein